MSQIDIGETVCEAVDQIVTKRLEGIKFDKTINCTVINDEEAKSGKYQVTDGSASFYAYAASMDYKKNDAVYVTVPNGDFNNQKIIIGKQVTKDTTPFLFTTPFDTMVDVSTNLINVSLETSYLLANYPNPYEKLVWSKDFKANNQTIAGFTRLGIQGQFQSWLDSFKCIGGDYGYKLILHCEMDVLITDDNKYKISINKANEFEELTDEVKTFITNTAQITIDWNEITTKEKLIEFLENELNKLSYQKMELYLSSVDDMYGNPYNFDSYYQQEKVFDISGIKQINKMDLYFYEVPESFKDKNGENVPYVEDFDQETKLMPNLFSKDPYICLGYDIATFEDDQANIYCLDPTSYSKNSLVNNKNNNKNIVLRWIHRFEDDRIAVVPDLSELEYEIRWYRYKHGAAAADEYCGIYWERIPNQDKFYFTLEPNIQKESEQIKAVILYNGKVIRSNILAFNNQEDVVNNATIDFLSGLNIWCKDNTYGNYFIYDPGNDLLEEYDVKQARELVALFSPKASLTSTELEGSLLTEATSITWSFPTRNTMLRANGIQSVVFEKDENTTFSIASPGGKQPDGTDTIKYNEKGDLLTIEYGTDNESETIVYDHQAGRILITRTGDVNNGNAINSSQLYFINQSYIQEYADNVVQCSIIKDNVEYFTSKPFYFGQAGTSGTDVTLKIYIDPANQFALKAGGDTMHCRALLFDSHNKEIDPNNESEYADVTYEWRWHTYYYNNKNTYNNEDIVVKLVPGLDESNYPPTATENAGNQIIRDKVWSEVKEYKTDDEGNYIDESGNIVDEKEKAAVLKTYYDLVDTKAKYYSTKTRNEVYISAGSKLDMDHLLILECTVKGWGGYDLTAYKPIAIKSGDEYSYANTAHEVIYLTSGYPKYYKGRWKLFLSNTDENYNDGTEDEETGGLWQIYNPFKDGEEDKEEFVGSIDPKTNVFKPVGIYIEGSKPYGVRYIKNGQAKWTQPIICLKNNYPSGTLNKWPGKEIKIDKENGYILAPAIAAGKKNSDNTFSGVMLGDWSIDPEGINYEIKSQTGIYGFHHGMMSYAFKENGTAFIGKSGKGRILLDGDKSTIQSEGYNDGYGTLIDLDNNIIEMKNGKGGIKFNADSSLYVDFSSSDKDSLFHIDTSNNSYYLQSQGYQEPTSEKNGNGVRIDLANNRIDAFDFVIEGKGSNGGHIKIDSTDGSILSTWGNIGGFTITDHSIFSGAGTISNFEAADKITSSKARTYWGKSSHNASTYDFRLGNSLFYDGSFSANGKTYGKLYLASNLYSIIRTEQQSSSLLTKDQLDSAAYFIFGINNVEGNTYPRLQIGSASSDNAGYDGISIYGNGGAIYFIPKAEGQGVKKHVCRMGASSISFGFNMNTSESDKDISTIYITKTELHVNGIKPEKQFGIYARFAPESTT